MEVQLNILNLKCGGCANSITNGLTEIEGVDSVKVDVEKSSILVELSDDVTDIVLSKLDKMGYPTDPDANGFLKQAKSYVSCMVGRVS